MTAVATTTHHAGRTPYQLLQSFCAAGHEPREWMKHPFRVDEWAYATNGHWIARMHAPGLGKLPAHTAKHLQHIGAMFMEAPFHLLQPMPHFDCPPCAACGGSGLARWVTCTHCRGKGYNGKRQACGCLHCYGAGKVAHAATAEDPAAHACWDCSGTGFERLPGIAAGDLRAQHQGARFQSAYLATLSRLPGIHFAAAPNGELTPAAFRFQGGEGLLMPCQPPHRATA